MLFEHSNYEDVRSAHLLVSRSHVRRLMKLTPQGSKDGFLINSVTLTLKVKSPDLSAADIAGFGSGSSDTGNIAAPVFAKLSDTSDQSDPSDKREKRTGSVLRGRGAAYFSPMNLAALL